MSNYIIYSIEDDKQISLIINKTLTKEGYLVKSFYDGESFLEEYKKNKPNMILLDLMLPNIQGMELLNLIKEENQKYNVSVIIVSAKETLEDKVEGLDSGADDYIVKPFDLSELRSRVNALLRRQFKNSDEINIGDYKFLINKEEVYYKGKKVDLTKTETKILMKLINSRKNIITREDLFKVCNPKESTFNSRTIDMHIKSIRNKLNDKDGKLILSIYGKGYMIE